MATRIFSTRFNDESQDSVAGALGYYDEWDLSEENIEFITNKALIKYDIKQHPGIDDYIAVFTDDPSLYKGLQKYTYKILAWFEAGTTVSSRTYVPSGNTKCWEFVGANAEPKIRMRYRNKSLMRDKAPLHPTQIGFRYLS